MPNNRIIKKRVVEMNCENEQRKWHKRGRNGENGINQWRKQ
jgi:hypothetical protein